MEKEIKAAIAAGNADYIEVRIQMRDSSGVSYVGRELEDIGERTSLGGSVRALVNGGWGFVAFNDTSDIAPHVREACRLAALVEGGTSSLAAVELNTASVEPPEQDETPRDVPLDQKHDICRRYNDILLNASKKIATTNVIYRDSWDDIIFANSEGTYIEQRRSFCGIHIAAAARDGSDIQFGRHSVGDMRGFGIVRNLDEKCEEAVKRAVEMLQAGRIPGGRYDVIMDQRLCGVFAHEAFGHLSEADFIFENPRMREIMRLGRRFGSEKLSIVDDPTLPRDAGSYAFDSEGVAARRTYLLKEGELTGRLHSRETAAIMGEEPTGNARAISYEHEPIVRMSNTIVLPGESNLDEMLAGMKRGLYVIGFLGGQTNMEMFTFTPEEAWLVEDGKLVKKVRDMTLTGNVFETLKNIELVGDDLEIYGGLGGCGKYDQSPLPVGDGGPHIYAKDIVVGASE